MKRLTLTIRTWVLVVFVGLSVVSALRAQVSRQLYLVTGLATPKDNFMVPTAVYRVDRRSQIATSVVELTGPSDGVDFVQVDHDRRLIVAGSPNVKPSRLVVLSMDAPSNPRSISTGSYFTLIQNFLFEDRAGRLMEAFQVGPCCTQDRLIGFDLLATDPSTVSRELPWNEYRYVHREGEWFPGDETRVDVFPRGGSLLLDPNKGMADLGVSFPSNITPQNDDRFLLDVNNDETLVINRAKMPGKEFVGEGGASELLVYDKKLQRWSTLHFPGAGSSVRGFGPWLAVGQADTRRTLEAHLHNDWRNDKDSPGGERRQTRLRSGSREQDGGNSTVDGLFKASRNYYPGILHLYDVRSRKRYQITTDQGDSEVLLIDGDTVYYRVNQNLYSAALGTSGLGNSKLILSDETVQLSHWAFIGPK